MTRIGVGTSLPQETATTASGHAASAVARTGGRAAPASAPWTGNDLTAGTASGATHRSGGKSAGEPEAPGIHCSYRCFVKGALGEAGPAPHPDLPPRRAGGAARPSASGGAGCASAMGKKHKKHKAEKAEWRSTSATSYSGKGREGLFVPGTGPPLPPARLSAEPGVPARAGGPGQRPCSECRSCRRRGRPEERGVSGGV